MMDIRTYLAEKRTVLFDGAMGTCYAARHPEESCELADLRRPEEIREIHRAYLDAGCQAITTNSFALSAAMSKPGEAKEIVDAACRIALEAAEPYGAWVFADIGPAPAGNRKVYQKQADWFLQAGIRHFLLETLPSDEGVPELARHLKARCPDAFLIVSYAVAYDGCTREGFSGRELFRNTAALPEVDAVGFNCVSGPHHLLEYIQHLDLDGAALSVMPNAGYPTVLGRRTVYQGTPEYFGRKLAEIAQAGAVIVGGCCGTTPAHLASAAKALAKPRNLLPAQPAGKSEARPAPEKNPLADKLDAGRRVIAVELDPPVDDQISFFMEGVQALRRAGADAVTIADNPIGRPRADSCLLACKIKRELGAEPLPHMTCRDRNRNAAKSLLLGLSIQGVHNVLLVTGDPIPSEDRDEVKSVFNFNSRKLIRYVSALNQNLRTPFRVFGALNVNAKNFDIQLRIAQEKEEAGAAGFLTQPILSPEALENLKLARKSLHGAILGGIYPVVSYRNACFLKNEIAGMHICDEIAERYRDLDRDAAEELAVTISTQMAKMIAPYTNGLYLMTPFKRVTLMTRILGQVRYC